MSHREKIIETLKQKSSVKQEVHAITQEVFTRLKDLLQEYAVEANEELEDCDKRVKMAYQDRGHFEAQLQVASDILLFVMHTNVFKFPAQDPIWKSDSLSADPSNGYFGVVNVYNFLADSFKYNRAEDHGHLVCRIFINRRLEFFVQSDNSISYCSENLLSRQKLTQETIIEILERIILYVIDEFELEVSPYDSSTEVNLEQFNTKTEHSKLRTSKR